MARQINDPIIYQPHNRTAQVYRTFQPTDSMRLLMDAVTRLATALQVDPEKLATHEIIEAAIRRLKS